MFLFFPYIVSVLMGMMAISLIFSKSKPLNFFLLIFFSVGLGLGISSFLTFISFIFFQGYHPFWIWVLNGCSFFYLLVLFKKYHGFSFFKKHPYFKKDAGTSENLLALFLDVLIFFFFTYIFKMIYDIAFIHPFGEWDAIGIWNIKAKYLLESGLFWKNCFLLKQPDYPILLPLVNVWGASFFNNGLNTFPLITGVVFTVSCGGVLYGALREEMNSGIALIPSGLLLFLPPFIYLGTSQYADVVVAYYLLSSVVCLMFMIKTKEKAWAILFGLFLGLGTFTKNEGVFSAGILLFLSIIYLIFEKKDKRFLNISLVFRSIFGFFIAFFPTLILKLFFISKESKSLHFNLTYFNLESLGQVVVSFFKMVSAAQYHYLWFLLLAMFFLNYRKYFYKEVRLVMWFYFCYTVLILIVYLLLYPIVYGTHDFTLAWLLETSQPRVILTQVPVLIYLGFYAHWRKEAF